jgi:CelD/BcsL family acetyltransferase involved in cellulose biosynthesis
LSWRADSSDYRRDFRCTHTEPAPFIVKITTIAGKDLAPDLAGAWAALQRVNVDIASPYFHPEFTRCAAGVSPNVEIAIVEDGGKIVAFFPFERVSRSIGGPAGGMLSDYHGLASAGAVDFDPLDLLRACKLIAWDFSHLPAAQSPFLKGAHALTASPQISLEAGYAAYARRKQASGSGLIDRAAYLARRLEREVGPMRYQAHDIAPSALDQVLAWKSSQYLRSGTPDIFRLPWTGALLSAIHETQTDGFAGVLSTLHAGDRLIAGHFGMRSQSVWHYWFPSYDPAFAKYSPGLILILKMAESASGLGVRMIDLGAGMSQQKERLATGSVMLAAGSIETPTWRSARRGLTRSIAALVRNSPLEAPARAILRRWRAPPGS